MTTQLKSAFSSSKGAPLLDTVFDDLLGSVQDVTATFDLDLGGLPEMLRATSSGMGPMIDYVRQRMEQVRLAPGEKSPRVARLVDLAEWIGPREAEFSGHLRAGLVAAVDGTPLIQPRRLLAGQAYAVAVGAVSAQQILEPQMRIVQTVVPVRFQVPAPGGDTRELVAALEAMAARSRNLVMDTSWPDAFLEYEVRRYACEGTRAPFVLVDGPLASEVVTNRRRGQQLLERMFADERVFVGVAKSIMSSPLEYRLIARALRPGEAYVVETQRDYLLRAGNRTYVRWIDQYLGPILRGIYKPGAKAFGFQCRVRDFEAALGLLWCDRDEVPGHEIPFLLNQVDQQLRSRFSLGDIEAVVEGLLAETGEEAYFDEQHERNFR